MAGLLSLASVAYGGVAAARRRASTRPGRQRRLPQPVISVGNLRVGGTGKTPVVASLAAALQAAGERPAILSRGYGRRRPVDGVVVVSDGQHLRADLDRSGDEPLMLARVLNGVPVLVCARRYLAGCLAASRFGTTVHLLDDGFQHLALARDLDLVILTPEDEREGRVLPAGRLREPLETIRQAHAILVPDVALDEARAMAGRLGVGQAFQVTRRSGSPRRLDAVRGWAPLEPGAPVLAVAGIARPARFFDDAVAAGMLVRGTMTFRDHHRYDAADVRAIATEARRVGASVILTTEKDLMRVLPFRPLPLPLAWLPLTAAIEPADAFRAWLLARLAEARA